MELLIAALIGLAVGIAASVLARPARLVGRLLIPAVSVAVALAFWAGATRLISMRGWEWLSYDRPWIWVTLGVIVVFVAVALAIVLPLWRGKRDAELLDRLSHAGSGFLNS